MFVVIHMLGGLVDEVFILPTMELVDEKIKKLAAALEYERNDDGEYYSADGDSQIIWIKASN